MKNYTFTLKDSANYPMTERSCFRMEFIEKQLPVSIKYGYGFYGIVDDSKVFTENTVVIRIGETCD